VPAPERIVREFVAALEREDGAAIAAMVSPRVDASGDIAHLLATYGGMRPQEVTMTWLDEFEGRYVVATVTVVVDDGTTVQLAVPVSRDDGTYHLAIGQAPLGGPVSGPHSPAP
jgi:hypothetical protein